MVMTFFVFYNSFYLLQFSPNTVGKSINRYTEKISVGGEGSIQKRTRHHKWDAP